MTLLLLALSMYVDSIDNARIVSDLSSPSFRRYVRHVYPLSLTDYDLAIYHIREYVVISGDGKTIY